MSNSINEMNEDLANGIVQAFDKWARKQSKKFGVTIAASSITVGETKLAPVGGDAIERALAELEDNESDDSCDECLEECSWCNGEADTCRVDDDDDTPDGEEESYGFPESYDGPVFSSIEGLNGSRTELNLSYRADGNELEVCSFDENGEKFATFVIDDQTELANIVAELVDYIPTLTNKAS